MTRFSGRFPRPPIRTAPHERSTSIASPVLRATSYPAQAARQAARNSRWAGLSLPLRDLSFEIGRPAAGQHHRPDPLNIARRQHVVSAAHYESGFEVLLRAGSFVLLGQIETQAIVMIALLALIFVALLLLLGMWLK